jgi:cytochrome c oxidase subunit 1
MATIDIHPQTSTHHHDDHAHEHEHHGNFWTNYVFSEDHKVIAKQFLITGMAWALIGGVLSVLFRLQLGFPDADLILVKTNLRWLVNSRRKD